MRVSPEVEAALARYVLVVRERLVRPQLRPPPPPGATPAELYWANLPLMPPVDALGPSMGAMVPYLPCPLCAAAEPGCGHPRTQRPPLAEARYPQFLDLSFVRTPLDPRARIRRPFSAAQVSADHILGLNSRTSAGVEPAYQRTYRRRGSSLTEEPVLGVEPPRHGEATR